MSSDLARPQLEQSLNPVQRTIIYRAFKLDEKSAELKNLLLTVGTEALRILLEDLEHSQSKQILTATGLDVLSPKSDLIEIELRRLLHKALSAPSHPLETGASSNYASYTGLLNQLITRLTLEPANQYTELVDSLLNQAKAALYTNAERNYLTGVTFFIGLCRLVPDIDNWLALIDEETKHSEANTLGINLPKASRPSAPRAELRDIEG